MRLLRSRALRTQEADEESGGRRAARMAAVLRYGEGGVAVDRARARAWTAVLERVLVLAAVAVAYYGLGRASLTVALPPGVATPLWPPSGVAFGAILVIGRWVWPAVLLGSFFLNSLVLLQHGRPEWIAFGASLLIGIGSTLQAVVGAYCVKRLTGGRPLFVRGGDVFRFLGASIFVCLLGASFGTVALLGGKFIGVGAAGATWRTWWIGDLVGILVFAPLLLSLVRHSYQWIDRNRVLEFGVFCVFLTVVTGAVFQPLPWERAANANLTFFVNPFLIWAAFRFRQAGVALSLLLVTVVAVEGTLTHSGPFGRLDLNQSLLLLQVFLGTLSITGITIAAILEHHRDVERERLECLEREKAARLDLSRSNRDLEHFAYLASHDLQEPLRTVSLHLSLLKRRCGDNLDPESDRSLEFAVGGAKRMKALIDNLLRYARINSDSGGPFSAVVLDNVVRDVVRSLEGVIRETETRIHVESLPTVNGDPLQLGQLFQNLISNATRFHGSSTPEIRIGCRRKNREWELFVEDNGAGFEMAHAERIFEIFQKLDGDRSGTGLGLAICRKIVQRHGGRIWAVSQVGRGSTFYFTLPAA